MLLWITSAQLQWGQSTSLLEPPESIPEPLDGIPQAVAYDGMRRQERQERQEAVIYIEPYITVKAFEGASESGLSVFQKGLQLI